jgi:hypothetical protein
LYYRQAAFETTDKAQSTSIVYITPEPPVSQQMPDAPENSGISPESRMRFRGPLHEASLRPLSGSHPQTGGRRIHLGLG